MDSKFSILMSSDEEYDDLCAEIYFEKQFVAMLTQEKGFENLEIEIYPPDNEKFWHFKLSEFEEVLKSAKDALWDIRKSID